MGRDMERGIMVHLLPCDLLIETLTTLVNKVREKPSQREVDLGEALLDMYSQYCHDGHSFMSAGEGASAVLEQHGYATFDEAGRMDALQSEELNSEVK